MHPHRNERPHPFLGTSAAPLLVAPHSPAAATPPQPPEARPIKIENGKLLGVLTTDQKVIAYKGIPYAQPPVDELRWRPPQPIGKWKKVLYRRDFGPHCLQSGSYPDMVFHDPGPSEDCLTLNVWAPSDAKPTSKKSAGLPVMVWIYGGGFTTGGTSENRQDGQFLAHRGVIVVSMNYRLGIFGFLALPELTGESANHTSGNYGLMDQTAAIAWVRRNIAAFGGDPANITVFGQSAGSSPSATQMASPLASGLFAKAIGQSGAELTGPAVPCSRWQQARAGRRRLGRTRLRLQQALLPPPAPRRRDPQARNDETRNPRRTSAPSSMATSCPTLPSHLRRRQAGPHPRARPAG